jgi:hydroxymethylglutaryl-CoA synthase
MVNATGHTVGIDALAFACPKAYLDLSTLAEARGVDPLKYTQGLGQEKMAIASPCEDTVTMAVEAGRLALKNYGIDPKEIGTLIVGTETGVDHSKPVAVYVHELLGLSHRCRTFETKHACYGASAGLTASLDWIASGRAKGRKALVIASDIASYGLKTAGEPTQGAGAVAMVVSHQPRLLEIDTTTIGDYTRQVMDFWRPLYSKYAFADGHFSIECYLEALSEARSVALEDQAEPIETLRACLYHVPFVKMAKKAHFQELCVAMGRDLDLGQPADEQLFANSFARKVAPFLRFNAQVGNIYTGSLYLSVMDCLSQIDQQGLGASIGLFSYGSGCGATYCLGKIAPTIHTFTSALDITSQLVQRRRLNIEDYEALIAEREVSDQASRLDPSDYNLNHGLAYVGTRNHQRQYEWLSD